MLVGISGYARSGKDTAADFLVAEGFIKLAFADPMRHMAAEIDPIVGFERDPDGVHMPVRYVEAVAGRGYDEAKVAYPEIRRFLQRLGTEAGRGVLGNDVWVHAAMDRLPGGKDVVFADMRFGNEAVAIEERGGVTVRIERPGIGPVTPHPSEVELDGWRFMERIENDSTADVLAGAIMEAVAKHRR